MAKYLVTGGTGLIGSNVVRILLEGNDDVRALVRAGSDYQPLVELGVGIFEGDVQSSDDFVRAALGCDAIINSAAVLGGAAQHIDEQRLTNVAGSFNAYDAAAHHGVRVVTLSSTPFLDHRTTLTEDSPVAVESGSDPYSVTKRAAYIEAKRRAEEGADINIVIPGGTFGPGLVLSRAMSATSFNRVIRGAVNGKVAEYLTYPVPWVYVEDVAAVCVGAAKRGSPGRTYLAFGEEDAQSTASWLNVALEVAGVPQRVAELQIDPSDEEMTIRYGPSLVELSQRRFPVPWFDNSRTRKELGYQARPLRAGLQPTIDWLRANKQIP